MEMFNEEIQNTNTNYFIFDTGKVGHRDLDFNYYTWNKRRYNIVKPNSKDIRNLLLLRKNHIDEIQKTISNGGNWVINIKSKLMAFLSRYFSIVSYSGASTKMFLFVCSSLIR